MQLPKNINKYESILVIVTGMLLLYIIFDNRIFLYIAGSIGLLSLISSTIADGVVWLWYKIAQVLGWINSRILLSLVFFIFLFPISLLFRLFNKDNLKLNRQDDTIFKTRNHKYEKKDLENIW